MIKNIVKSLVENIEIKKKENIDLILSGGAFNVSYMLGVLFFLQELEEKQKIKINRISTCSASSILGLLYLINKLDLFNEKIYDKVLESYKKNKIVFFDDKTLKEIKEIIKINLPDNICEIVNNRLIISYFDVNKCKKIVKKKYKNKDDIIESVIRSCYIPTITMREMLLDNRYMDGIMPYIIKRERGINRLYVNMISKDKLEDMIVIKNNKTNMHRILEGLLDVHKFYLKRKETIMCKYIEKWSIMDKLVYKIMIIISYIICLKCFLIKLIGNCKIIKYFKNRLLNEIMIGIRRICIEHYCM